MSPVCQLSVRTKPFSHNLTPNFKCSANLCHFNVFLFHQRWSLSGGFVTGSPAWLKSLHTSSSRNMTDGTLWQPAQWRTIRYDDTAHTGGIRCGSGFAVLAQTVFGNTERVHEFSLRTLLLQSTRIIRQCWNT